jgi:hypothetical protein
MHDIACSEPARVRLLARLTDVVRNHADSDHVERQ